MVAETIRIKTLSLYPCGMVNSFVNFSKTNYYGFLHASTNDWMYTQLYISEIS